MDPSAKTWNRLAAGYSRQAIADPGTYEKKLALTRNYLTASDQVLEFGCGTGGTALLHAPYVQNIVAVDYSDQMIAIANKAMIESEVTNVTFECATLFDVNAEPGQFDAILGLNVLHLIPDFEQSIRKASELLKPGGYLVTSTVCISNPLFRLLLPLLGYLRVIPPVQFIREAELRAAMMSSGLQLVDELPVRGQGVRSVFLVAKKQPDPVPLVLL